MSIPHHKPQNLGEYAMNFHAESASVSVVLLGRFNPDKFLPENLLAGKMITKSVASAISITTLLPGQTIQLKFALGDLLVAQDRFQLVTKDAPYIRIADFAIKAVAELASDSVVTAFGINCESEFHLLSVDARNDLGIKLAPPGAWGKWGDSILKSMQDERKGTRLQGGVMFLQLRELFEEGDVNGWLDECAHLIRWFDGQVYRWLGEGLRQADQAGGDCVRRDVACVEVVRSQW